MNKNDALANLKPLIAPEPISWWQLAPGWWLVGIALMLASISLSVWSWKRWQHYRGTRYQREALALLEPIDNVTDIALVIRRVAISVLGRSRAAAATWREICPTMDEPSLQLLTELQYKKHNNIAIEAIEQLRQQTKLWIQHLPAVKK